VLGGVESNAKRVWNIRSSMHLVRTGIAVFVGLWFCGAAMPQKQKSTEPVPGQFEIARHYFFDFGPPNDSYELFLVSSSDGRTDVEKVSLTPAGDKCFAPATVEVKTATLPEDIPTLLGSTSPCSIPEKELRRELKRCKKCLVYSGAQVTLQVQCGGQTRLIRSDIPDRDMFDPGPKTPEHTSWTMRLLAHLDDAMGPGVIDRPMFSVPSDTSAPRTKVDGGIAEEISSGKFDAVFADAPDKPSELFRQAQIPAPTPAVRLVSAEPIGPEVFNPPQYPPLARLAHVEGAVSVRLELDESGGVTNATIQSGHPLLQGVVKEAVLLWKFPKGEANREVLATIEFASNCPRPAN
jgi:TonB family protein